MSLKQVLMNRDGLTSAEADEEIGAMSKRMLEALDNGEDLYDVIQDEWELEPDYLEELGIF